MGCRGLTCAHFVVYILSFVWF